MVVYIISYTKRKVKNKAYVEASIVRAYIEEKIGMFTSYYFELDMASRSIKPLRNYIDNTLATDSLFSVFNHPN